MGQKVGKRGHLSPDELASSPPLIKRLLWMYLFRSVLAVLGIVPDSETSSQAQTGVAPDSQNSSQVQTSQADSGHVMSNSDKVVTEKS